MENAIKYGDGTGIKVSIDKQEEGYYFSVKNKGKLLPENEIPYIFGSFWRGSNAQGVKGSGIGLFEARTIASRLGGDIYVKQDDEEIEFIVFIEK
jgi:signal transduction histidine kinase